MQTTANVASLTFRVAGLAEDDLRVVRLDGSEQLSELFSYRLELCSPRSGLRPQQMLKAAATLEIHGPRGVRTRNGVIRSFESLGSDATWNYYAVELVPVHWLLTKRVGCRIFQAHNCPDMTVPGIVRKVLEDAGLASDSYRFATTGDYPVHDYVVQYRESEWQFVMRLLEDEGIFTSFEETEAGTVLVLGDEPAAHAMQPDAIELRSPDALERAEEDAFSRLCERGSIEHGAVGLDDYNFRQPGQDLAVARSAGDFASLPHNDYPGDFAERPAGERLAQIRLEAWKASQQRVEMQGDVRCLAAGEMFELQADGAPDYEGRYLAVGVRVSATQPQSLEQQGSDQQNTFRLVVDALAGDVPYRPLRVTPRPTVRGTQTAIVVGPKEEEIYTDPYGRVKVQFPWEPDGQFNENSSCWIRVSQGSAGGQYGMLFLPRVGHEVIVDFLEGNPSKPIITGRVYNRDQMPPYNLPEEKTKSGIKTHTSKGGGGANEICFEDAEGSEQLSLFAERELHIRTKGSHKQRTGGHHHESVGGEHRQHVKKDRHLWVEGQTMDIHAGPRLAWYEKECFDGYDGYYEANCKDQYVVNTQESVVIDASKGITLKCGGNFLTIDQSGIWLNGQHVGLNSGGTPIPAKGAPAGFEQEKPVWPDKNTPGQDTRYDGGDVNDPNKIDPGPNNNDDDPTNDKETSWIEIEMHDELGRPWAGEEYEIEEPDGQLHHGTLDAKGRARVKVQDPGVCQIRFPKLDADAWRRSQ